MKEEDRKCNAEDAPHIQGVKLQTVFRGMGIWDSLMDENHNSCMYKQF